MKIVLATLSLLTSALLTSGFAAATLGEVIGDAPARCRGLGINCDEKVCEDEWTTSGWKEVCHDEHCTVYALSDCQVVIGDGRTSSALA